MVAQHIHKLTLNCSAIRHIPTSWNFFSPTMFAFLFMRKYPSFYNAVLATNLSLVTTMLDPNLAFSSSTLQLSELWRVCRPTGFR